MDLENKNDIYSEIKILLENARAKVLKEPYILEFLGLESMPNYSENQLESAIIAHIEKFIMELGKGFLF